ncbi:hypothetical protein KIN20_029787 [Parelaphostrongylus tenuis]|uniref:M-phase phosphoprotein 6 n=1 Tax=Parelaphostrongylus tenuis TaxID=148309 RepID=A0AAD5WGD5_PARTN|nr:hypothetical protein KIN20_029787 [Parelaphostrongylus tenuis]
MSACGAVIRGAVRRTRRQWFDLALMAHQAIHPSEDRTMSELCKRLSSTVLEMKFMQKTKRRLEARERKRREAELRRQCFENEDDAAEPKRKLLNLQFSNDLTYLQGLKFGRMSFKGCNPEVEKLMIYHERKMNGEDSETDSDDGKDVADQEMAKTLRSATLTNAQKSALNRNRKPLHLRSSDTNESVGERLNFTDIRKRRSGGTWASGISKKKLKGND